MEIKDQLSKALSIVDSLQDEYASLSRLKADYEAEHKKRMQSVNMSLTKLATVLAIARDMDEIKASV